MWLDDGFASDDDREMFHDVGHGAYSTGQPVWSSTAALAEMAD